MTNENESVELGGLTAREYFAGMALQGLLASSGGTLYTLEETRIWPIVASNAAAYADGLITALNDVAEDVEQ